ncbi:MAG: hypothetical protein R2824_30435 [Saprospiraceae bacterium]|nr:hypothetical protein [Lewinella sp.]
MRNWLLCPLWSVYLLLLIACNDNPLLPCEEAIVDDTTVYPVFLHDLFPYHPMIYRGKTYISQIDEIIAGRRFNQQRPDLSFNFKSCEEAQNAAEQDFRDGSPALIQFNGITGKSSSEYETYFKVLGVHIENTGCLIYNYDTCYNKRAWALIEEYFGGNVSQRLKLLELQYRYLAIDPEKEQTVKVDQMPVPLVTDSLAIYHSDTIRCRQAVTLLGRYLVQIDKAGNARILDYLEGSLDCDCDAKMRTYFESLSWTPAIIGTDSIDAIVAFQFIG